MKYESNNFQFEAEMPWESAGEGIVRQIMGYNDNLMMVKVKFETGAIGTPHTHPKPGILNGCICLEAGVLIDTFSPMREDFL